MGVKKKTNTCTKKKSLSGPVKCPPCCPTPPLAARLKEASARQSVLRQPTLTRHLPDTQRLPRVWALGRCSKGGGGDEKGVVVGGGWDGRMLLPQNRLEVEAREFGFLSGCELLRLGSCCGVLRPKVARRRSRFSKSEAATVSIFVYVWSGFQL